MSYAYRTAFRNAHGTSGYSPSAAVVTAAGPNVRSAYRYRATFALSAGQPVIVTSAETGPEPTDADGDQLTGGEELAIGSNPHAFSTDGDTLGDGFERSSGLTNGTRSMFRVAAVNAAGTGTRSDSSAAFVPATFGGFSEFSAPTQMVTGTAVPISGRLFDQDGTAVDAIRVYRDADGNGVLDVAIDQLLHADPTPGDGFEWDTSTLASGVHRLFTAAMKGGSVVASTPLTVTAAQWWALSIGPTTHGKALYTATGELSTGLPQGVGKPVYVAPGTDINDAWIAAVNEHVSGTIEVHHNGKKLYEYAFGSAAFRVGLLGALATQVSNDPNAKNTFGITLPDDTKLIVLEDLTAAKNNDFDYDDQYWVVTWSPLLVDLDVDSNNDGKIDPDNTAAGTDDPIEEQSPGCILFVNSDDDDRNGVADVVDVGRVSGENDLVEIVVAAAPAVSSGVGSLIVTYDETLVRLYARPDRSGGIVSGSSVAGQSVLYAEGRTPGTSLVTVAWTVGGLRASDTVRLTVPHYPATIDVDIDSDNNNDFLPPTRSEWEDTLENHDYGIGKLIMLDNQRRPLTPIVMELPTGLPVNSPAVGVRVDWSATGPAGQVRLWNRFLADAVRNPAAVTEGGNQILPGIVCKLSDLNYNPQTGTIMIWAEGVRENEQLKTLAGVEAAPRVDERIRGTLVVNGDAAAFDEVKYIVANEDSFYYALHTKQEVRNALASRGVYTFVDLPKFSLERKSPLDLRGLGVPDDANLLLGEGSGIAGFKAMVYQDYITGEDQYVLAFAGTDDTFGQFLDWLLFGAEGDWKNNFDQGLGRGTPPQYEAAMKTGDGLSKSDGIHAGHLIVTGHSLGGGLATAAAVVGGFRADTFNAAWLRKETLLEPDGLGGTRARYPGSLVNFAGAVGTINAHYVDWDILTYFQTQFRQLDPTIASVGLRHELDGPHDFNLTVADPIPLASLYYMSELHKNSSVLYGLLVTEDRLGHITIDLLGYIAYFS